MFFDLQNRYVFIVFTLIFIVFLLITFALFYFDFLDKKTIKDLFCLNQFKNYCLRFFEKIDLYLANFSITKEIFKKYHFLNFKIHFSLFLFFIFTVYLCVMFTGVIYKISIFWQMFFVFIFLLFIKFFIEFKYSKLLKRINEELPSIFEALSYSLKASYNFPNAIAFVALEANEPLKTYLKNFSSKLSLNQSMSLALKYLEEKIEIPDISFFCSIIEMQQKTGGNLTNVLDRFTDSLRERLKFEKDIASYTAQGKLSALLLVLLGPFSILIFSFLSPSYVAPLFNTKLGNFLVFFALFLDLIGFLWIRKIIKIKF